jgi:catalase
MKKTVIKNENAKLEQLSLYKIDNKDKTITTLQGVKVNNIDDSLKAGSRGPTLLQDFTMREKITHFDHERIPERVVHARGVGAHGYFQVYECMSELTYAEFLQDPNKKTPVFVRFSTVVGSRGSADTVRDVRGFATKFYTGDGNYDIVGNNIPVFFIQDAMKFPDLIHAAKPEPDTEIPQAATAHDTFWDFVASMPETAHMIMWLMSDRAIPRSFRMMEGFGVNTFRLVNTKGVSRFVKFHWKPMLGVHSLVWDEAQKLAGKNSDFHRRDLYDAIACGKFPEYELGIQVIEEKDEFKFPFDVLDPTKIWPEELIPVRRIGKMTLNSAPSNFFAETEQVAFCPANIVPGIDFSNDPLLQGRLFSYLDTQLLRLGGPNFQYIPINRPLASIHNNFRDGLHRSTVDMGKVSYFPNNLMQNCPHTAMEGENSYAAYRQKVEGTFIRERSPSFKDHYSQAALFWNSMSTTEKQHIIDAFSFELGKVKDRGIRQKIVDMLNNIDGELSKAVADMVGAAAPQKLKKPDKSVTSPALSQANTVKIPATLKAGILIAEGFNRAEITSVMNAFKASGVSCDIISDKQGGIKASDGKLLDAAETFTTTASVNYDAIYIPGGRKSLETLIMMGDALHFINEAFKHAKPIGASNEGVDLLSASQITGVMLADIHSEGFVSDCGVVTVKNTKSLTDFTPEFIKAIGEHRHWCRCALKAPIPA